MNDYYTGVGSRETPKDIQITMRKLGMRLNREGYVLRSGAADGADSFFEAGCDDVNPERKQIFLPWSRFNNRTANEIGVFADYPAVINSQAQAIAKEIHPAWDKLSQGAQKLHTRNVYQVLGPTLNQPSRFLLYWAQIDNKGQVKGGTRTAVELAKKHNVPVFNLGDVEEYDCFLETLKAGI